MCDPGVLILRDTGPLCTKMHLVGSAELLANVSSKVTPNFIHSQTNSCGLDYFAVLRTTRNPVTFILFVS